MAKRLEQGGFRWPGIRDGVIRLTAAQMAVLLEGSDWRRVHGGRKPVVPQLPDRHGTARAMLSVQEPPRDQQNWDADRQKAWLRERFADAGWQTDRVLAGMEITDDFYFDALSQVRMSR